MTKAGFEILSCSTFGSHCYGLPLATSDFDIAVVLAAGQNPRKFTERFREMSWASPEFTCTQRRVRSDCHQTEFQHLPVDVKPIKRTRASDGACRSTDVLKFSIEKRKQEDLSFPAKLKAILIFKLICHQLDITQHHMKPRGQKIKAITLSYWAVAVCDYFNVDADVGCILRFLCETFLRFDWKQWKVAASAAGSIHIYEHGPFTRIGFCKIILHSTTYVNQL